MKLFKFMVAMVLALVMATVAVAGVSADTTVSSGPFTGCVVTTAGAFSCPAPAYGYAQRMTYAGTPYFACGVADSRCVGAPFQYTYVPTINYGYATTFYTGIYQQDTNAANVVAVTPDNRYCGDGVVYVVAENGVLVDRCDNGLRVFPTTPDLLYYFR